MRIIETRRDGLAEEDDLIDLLGQWLRQREQDPEHFSPEEMRDELLTMLIAGHHSLAIAPSWTLWEIAGNPGLQQRLRDEVDALDAAPSDTDDLRKLSLTQGPSWRHCAFLPAAANPAPRRALRS